MNRPSGEVAQSIIEKMGCQSSLLILQDGADFQQVTTPRKVVLSDTRIGVQVTTERFDFRAAKRGGSLELDLAEYIDANEKFDCIIVDHHHSLDSIVSQLGILKKLSHPKTIYVFDDAIPRNLEMASDQPVPGWWVGSVWAIAAVFGKRADNECLLLESRPAGICVLTARVQETAAWVDETRALIGSVKSVEEIWSQLPSEGSAKTDQFVRRHGHFPQPAGKLPVRAADGAEFDRAVREWLSEDTVLDRPAPVVYANLSNGLLTSRLDSPAKIPFGRTGVCSIKAATLVGTNAIFIEGAYYCRYRDNVAGRLDLAAATDEYNNEGSQLEKINGSYFLPEKVVAGARRLEGRYILLTPDERDNWGMWLLQAIPSIIYYLGHREEYSGVIAFARTPWQRAIIHSFGLGEHEVVFQQIGDHFSVDCLDWICRWGVGRNLAVTQFERNAFQRTLKILSEEPEARESQFGTYPKRIFISRQSVSVRGRRALMQESYLSERLTELGFAVVEPEKYSLAEQAKIFNNADFVVGLGGAGMFNAVFCKEGTTVVTIEGATHWIEAHVTLFSSLGHLHGAILGSPDLTDSQPEHKRWSIDVDAVCDLLTTRL